MTIKENIPTGFKEFFSKYYINIILRTCERRKLFSVSESLTKYCMKNCILWFYEIRLNFQFYISMEKLYYLYLLVFYFCSIKRKQQALYNISMHYSIKCSVRRSLNTNYMMWNLHIVLYCYCINLSI
jgi:hypothetical protein